MGRKLITAEEIYECLLDDDAFAQLPPRLADALGARSVLIHWHYGDESAQVLSHSGYFTDEQLQRYALDFASLDPWAAATAGQPANGLPLDLERHVSPEEYERSVFYNEYVRAMGDDTFRCIGLRSETRWGSGMIAVQRGKTQASFSERNLLTLDALAGHLRRLLDLRGRLAATERKSALLDQVLSSMRDAAMIVSPAGRLLHANIAGEALLIQSRGIHLRRGIIGAAVQSDEQRLRTAIAAACQPKPIASSILVRSGEWPPVVVSISPLHQAETGRKALLLINEVAPRAEVLQNRLQQLFGLTPSEAQIAIRLSESARPAEISEERQVSLGTIRIQIKSIYLKLGCSRQSQVMVLVRSIPIENFRTLS